MNIMLLSFEVFVADITLVIDESSSKIHLVLLQRVVVLYNNIEITKNVAVQYLRTIINLSDVNT